MRRGCWVVLAGGALLLAGAAACDGSPSAADRAGLVNDLAGRLDRADRLTYTAEYQLSGGATATIARDADPSRTAYTFPGGKLILLPTSTIDCRPAGATMTCTTTPVVSPGPGTQPTAAVAVLNVLGTRGMPPPAVVAGLLTATALDSDAIVQQRDTTIAGQHATCVDVSAVDDAAASSYELCVTTDGVLGSFAGTVNGTRMELALTQYRNGVDADAFDIPPGARS